MTDNHVNSIILSLHQGLFLLDSPEFITFFPGALKKGHYLSNNT